MDEQRFDWLARHLGTVPTRRSVLAGLSALLTGLTASNQEAAAKPVTGAVCLRLGKDCKDRRHRCCGSATCRGGTCRCSSSQRACGGRCIAKTKCCKDGDCGANGAVCRQGRCRCPQGQRNCDGTCIPTTACCGNDDCGACDSCVDRRCVSGCQDGQECLAETCRCTTSSCDGCCDGDACREGDRDGACGIDGEQCFACGDHADCVDGACACDDGFKPCDDGCIANAACCGGCGAFETCVDGTCRSQCGQGGPCLAFVTSSTHTGNLGGLTGADAICQDLAAAAGLPGTYMAWLSTSAASPSTRFRPSSEPYQLVTGTPIAASWAALTDGSLDAPLNRDEAGVQIQMGFDFVWTMTTPQGTLAVEQNLGTCDDWQSGDSSLFSVGGGHNETSAAWTFGGGYSGCSLRWRVYCFEQP